MSVRGFSRAGLTLAAVLLTATAARAQTKDLAEPTVGVAFQPRTGWFVETQLGVFTTFGGLKSASNGQPFMAISAGTGLDSLVPGLSAFVTTGLGFNAKSCHDVVTDNAGMPACASYKLADQSPAVAPEDFSVVPLEIGVRYGFWQIVPRLKLAATLVGGYTLFTPRIGENAPSGSPHAGVGLGIDYATRLPGLTAGVEVLVRTAFSPMLPSLAGYPRIQYVF